MTERIALVENGVLKLSKPRTQIRDIFGIVPITLYTRNFGCKISCVYCPQVSEIPKSYLKNEDTERALKVNYDPSLQLDYWISELDKKFNSSKPIKLEIIILGGTFGDLPQSYRENFFKEMYDKLNQCTSKNLEEAKELNKVAKYRACIVNIETRPDTITKNECSFLRKLGVSKIELGIQSLYDDILKFAGRPYTRKDVIQVSTLIREAGFKLGYHIMLNLPYSNIELDNLMLKEIIDDPALQPDFIKIYPLTLIKEREYQKKMWKLYDQNVWKPYNKEQLLFLLYQFKISIPEQIRIQRIQRQFDDSDYLYEDFEIRSLLDSMLADKNQECRCIRCQEIKTFKSKYKVFSKDDYELEINQIDERYFYFTVKSSENPKFLLGYLKLNLSANAIVREIKVVGKSSKIGKIGQIQGHGIGEFLISEAEKFVLSKGFSNLLINASPGVRGFFENLKYSEFNGFLNKQLYE